MSGNVKYMEFITVALALFAMFITGWMVLDCRVDKYTVEIARDIAEIKTHVKVIKANLKREELVFNEGRKK